MQEHDFDGLILCIQILSFCRHISILCHTVGISFPKSTSASARLENISQMFLFIFYSFLNVLLKYLR
jgi:hypothetical protein